MRDRALEDQSDVVDFLAAPATHGGKQVLRIDTHAAMVFVAGDRAYKIKRAVRFPYLDFSTLARRHAACENELKVNRRLAPSLYLGVQPIRRLPDGGLTLGGADDLDIVEWVLVMRAFAQDQMLDRLATSGQLDHGLITALADEIRRAHDTAARIDRDTPARGGARGMRITADENHQDLIARPDLFPARDVQRLKDITDATVSRLAGLLDERWDQGLVRRCHGDLHLRNIVRVEGRPLLFDAIEFDEAIARIDVLYDLAFLLMDLDRRGLHAEANQLFNRYLRLGDDLAGLAALPLFYAVRATIRAKVAAAAETRQASPEKQAAMRAEAGAYFQAALGYLAPPQPRLIAIGGFSGSGKSRVARALAPEIGAAPGALLLRSDVIRKQRLGLAETTTLPPAAYGPETHAEIYATMLDRARAALTAGHSVILDAVHAEAQGRKAIEALASALDVAFNGLWLDAPAALLERRTAARRGDASDATPAVVQAQIKEGSGEMTWQRLDAGQPLESVIAAARDLIAAARGARTQQSETA